MEEHSFANPLSKGQLHTWVSGAKSGPLTVGGGGALCLILILRHSNVALSNLRNGNFGIFALSN